MVRALARPCSSHLAPLVVTDIGVFPADWEIKSLDDLFTFSGGLSASRADLGEDGIPYLHYGDIHTSKSWSVDLQRMFADLPKIPISLKDAPISALLANGDIVFVDASEDTEGVSRYWVVQNPDSVPFLSGLHTIVAKEKSSDLIAPYKIYALQGDATKFQFKFYAVGTKVQGVNKTTIRKIRVAVPPKPQQEAVAEALLDADALIQTLEALIAKKRAIKQGAMQDLLSGRKRLPGFSGEWAKATFGEIFDFYPTATNSRADLSDDGDAFYVHYGDIHTTFRSHLNFSRQYVPRISRSRCLNAASLKNGDWIMADASEDYDGVGKSVEVMGLDCDTLAVSGLHTFLLREKVKTYARGFKGHLGNSDQLRRQYRRVMTGMKVYGVSKTALKDLVLPIPNWAEQEAIRDALSDIGAEIASLEVKAEKARMIKQGMMQELLTGRVRLV